METFIQEDSPLANYLEGSGEAKPDWISEDLTHPSSEPAESLSANFAPTGRPKLQDRIRNRLPAPLHLTHSNKRQTLTRIQDACVAALSARIGKGENERFLEEFGYIIVASQLLSHPQNANTSIVGIPEHLVGNNEEQTTPQHPVYELHGAIFSAFASFSLVGLFSWMRPRPGAGWNIKRMFIFVFFLAVVGIGFYILARRQWLKYIRNEALNVARILVGNAQNLDSVVLASVSLIQEVELVSRGYRLSTPMPPVTRLEEQSQTRRCLRLRRRLSECLSELLEQYLAAKTKLRHHTDTSSLAKYYDIYDFSPEELEEAESSLVDFSPAEEMSLRSLSLLYHRLYAVRKSMLCCLLAFPVDGTQVDATRWGLAVEEMQRIATASGDWIQRLTVILHEQDRDVATTSPKPTLTPATKERHRAQLRRLNSLSQGIRGLHAKMHLIREESDAFLERDSENSGLSGTLMSQYESIGADLRGLLQEWEAGKSVLLANIERPERLSHTSNVMRSPASPTVSLGGLTAVDGSPAAALRALNGEDLTFISPDHDMDDEEVFEAVALPRKRSSMTREERIARVQEDRAKRESARERVDANTHMLRELETVIKLRPRIRGGTRVTSI